MPNKHHKISLHTDIQKMFVSSKKMKIRDVLFMYLGNDKNSIRTCVIISKKFSKSAVKRNLMRRRINEAMDSVIKEKELEIFSMDVVVTYSKSQSVLSYKDCKDIVLQAMTEIIKRSENQKY